MIMYSILKALLGAYEALATEDQFLVVAILFFVMGAAFPLYLRKSKENAEKQRKEELDDEIMEQLREIEIMKVNHERNRSIRETIEYERMLEEMELPDFII